MEQPIYIETESFLNHIVASSSDDLLALHYGDAAGYVAFGYISLDGTFHKVTEQGLHDEEVTALVRSPDGQLFASADANGKVYLWEYDLTHVRYVTGSDNATAVVSLAFYDSGQQLIVGREDGYVQFYDVKTLDLRSGHNQQSQSLVGKPVIRAGYLDTLALSPNGRLLITSSGEDRASPLMDRIEFWDPATRQKIISRSTRRPVWIKEDYRNNALVFHPNGNMWASGGCDGIVRLYYPNGESRGWLTEQPGQISAIAFSPRGRHLATGYTQFMDHEDEEDKGSAHVTIWHTDKQTVAWELDAQKGGITALAFTPDGQKLFVARETEILEIHNLNL